MSDAVTIILSLLGFLLIIFFALLFLFPEELRKLLRRVAALDANTEGVSIKFFEEQASKIAELRGGGAPNPPKGQPFAGKSILWVDDNPENNFHEAAMFEALGANVRFAKDNQSAVRMAQEMPPLLLLSDIGRVNTSETGLDLPKTYIGAGLPLPPLVYYTGTKTDDATADGHQVTTLPTELFSAAVDAIESDTK